MWSIFISRDMRSNTIKTCVNRNSLFFVYYIRTRGYRMPVPSYLPHASLSEMVEGVSSYPQAIVRPTGYRRLYKL